MTKSILLVEDNPDDEALALRALRSLRVPSRVVVARDGEEALRYLEQAYDQDGKDRDVPALILLDLKLPKVDGLELLRRLRAARRTSLIPIVVLTNSNMEQDILQCYRLGANSYVRKPVDFQEFTSLLNHLGQYWLMINETPPFDGEDHVS